MMTLALHALESALNRYLKLDPETLSRFAKLEGKTVKWVIEDWHISFYIILNANGVELHPTMTTTPNTTITGKLPALLRLGLAKASNSALFENRIQIEGDLNTGETLRAILSDMDIDWEEHLSKIVGDIAAHKISTAAKEIKSSFSGAKQTLERNLKEFLQLELQALPTREQVNTFIDDVSHLQHAVERADVRIIRLQQQRDSHS